MLRYLILAISSVLIGTQIWFPVTSKPFTSSLDSFNCTPRVTTLSNSYRKTLWDYNMTQFWMTYSDLNFVHPGFFNSEMQYLSSRTQDQLTFDLVPYSGTFPARVPLYTAEPKLSASEEVTVEISASNKKAKGVRDDFMLSDKLRVLLPDSMEVFYGLVNFFIISSIEIVLIGAFLRNVTFGLTQDLKSRLTEIKETLINFFTFYRRKFITKLHKSVSRDFGCIKDALYYHCLCQGYEPGRIIPEIALDCGLCGKNIVQDLLDHIGLIQVGVDSCNWKDCYDIAWDVSEFKNFSDLQFCEKQKINLLIGSEKAFFYISYPNTSVIMNNGKPFYHMEGFATNTKIFSSLQYAKNEVMPGTENSFCETVPPDSVDKEEINLQINAVKMSFLADQSFTCSGDDSLSKAALSEGFVAEERNLQQQITVIETNSEYQNVGSSVYSEIIDLEEKSESCIGSLKSSISEYSSIKLPLSPMISVTGQALDSLKLNSTATIPLHGHADHKTHDAISSICTQSTKPKSPKEVLAVNTVIRTDDQKLQKLKVAGLSSDFHEAPRLQLNERLSTVEDDKIIFQRLQAPLPSKKLSKIMNIGIYQKGIMETVLESMDEMREIKIPQHRHLHRFKSSVDIIEDTIQIAESYAKILAQVSFVDRLFEDCRGVIREINESSKSIVDQIPGANTLFMTQLMCHELHSLCKYNINWNAAVFMGMRMREIGNLEKPLETLPDVFNDIVSTKFRKAASLQIGNESFTASAISSLSKIVFASDTTTIPQEIKKLDRIIERSPFGELSKKDTQWCRDLHNRMLKNSNRSVRFIESFYSELNEYASAVNKWVDYSLFRLEQLESLKHHSEVLYSISESHLECMTAKYSPKGLLMPFLKASRSCHNYSQVHS